MSVMIKKRSHSSSSSSSTSSSSTSTSMSTSITPRRDRKRAKEEVKDNRFKSISHNDDDNTPSVSSSSFSSSSLLPITSTPPNNKVEEVTPNDNDTITTNDDGGDKKLSSSNKDNNKVIMGNDIESYKKIARTIWHDSDYHWVLWANGTIFATRYVMSPPPTRQRLIADATIHLNQYASNDGSDSDVVPSLKYFPQGHVYLYDVPHSRELYSIQVMYDGEPTSPTSDITTDEDQPRPPTLSYQRRLDGALKTRRLRIKDKRAGHVVATSFGVLDDDEYEEFIVVDDNGNMVPLRSSSRHRATTSSPCSPSSSSSSLLFSHAVATTEAEDGEITSDYSDYDDNDDEVSPHPNSNPTNLDYEPESPEYSLTDPPHDPYPCPHASP